MRLIEGRDGWWCLGPGGTALVSAAMVAGGELTPAAGAMLSEAGVLTPRPVHRYSLTVLTTTSCNLGCAYCFQNKGAASAGRFDPPRIAGRVLQPSTVEHLVAFARDRLADLDGGRGLRLVLFGGEPLLAPDACVTLLRRCAELAELSATMVSNGVLLTAPLAATLSRAGLRSVQVSLDGPAGVHDAQRHTRSGRPTFDTVLDNVAAALATTDLSFTIRINLTSAGLPHPRALVHRLGRDLEPGRCGFGIAPVLDYGTGGAGPPSDALGTVRTILDGYALAHAYGFYVAAPSNRPCAFCAVPNGRYGAVVNADGRLFSCWDTAGRPGYAVGDVRTGYAAHQGRRWLRCGLRATSDATGLTDRVDAGLLDLIRRWRRDVATGPTAQPTQGVQP